MLRNVLTLALVGGTFATVAVVLWMHWNVPADATPQVQKEPAVRVDPRLVPAGPLRAYQKAGERSDVDWKLLAAIGKAESEHGRSPLPGVRNGINSAGCCAGPMQLCITDACGNVASLYARDGDGDGSFSVYDIDDASATAAAYIRWMRGLVGDDPRILAAAYNAGPTIVSKEGIPPYEETQQYVRQVARMMSKLERFG